MLMRESKRPLFVSVVAVMLCLMALAEYKDLRSIGDDEALLDWVFGASAVQLAYTVTCLVSLLCAVVTAVGLWEMRSWAMACYAVYAVVLVAEEVLRHLVLWFRLERGAFPLGVRRCPVVHGGRRLTLRHPKGRPLSKPPNPPKPPRGRLVGSV